MRKITHEQRIAWARKDPRQVSMFGEGHERELTQEDNEEEYDKNAYSHTVENLNGSISSVRKG